MHSNKDKKDKTYVADVQVSITPTYNLPKEDNEKSKQKS